MRNRGLILILVGLCTLGAGLTSCTRTPSDNPTAKGKGPNGEDDGPIKILNVEPQNVTIAVNNQLSFSVSGGVPPYHFIVGEGGNGTFDKNSGVYKASDRPGTTKIRVRDSKGNFGEAFITINPRLEFGSESRNVEVNERTIITPQNGVPPYAYSIIEGGGSIETIDGKIGNLRAPTKPGKMKIRITDSRGNTAETDFGAILATKIALGLRHTCALLEDGSIKCWGVNHYGNLGVGDKVNRGTPITTSIVNFPAVNLGTQNGDENGRPWKAISVVSGRNHACALLEKNQVKCWGRNFYGNLGIGSRSRQGDSRDTSGNKMDVVDLGKKDGTGEPRKALGLAAGENFTCVLMDDLRVKCFGANIFGQLGLGSKEWFVGDSNSELGTNLRDLDLGKNPATGEAYRANQLTAGRHHACAVLEDGRVKCWGRNFYGQLGYGDQKARGKKPTDMGDNLPFVDLGAGRKATQVVAGHYFTCALLDDTSVKCWGSNIYGQAAAGGGFWLWNKYRVGVKPEQMGDALKPVRLGLDSNRESFKARFLTGGGQSVCAIGEDRSVKCWGRNHQLQLGLPDGKNRGRDEEEMGDALPIVLERNKDLPSQVAVGKRHTCVMLDDRALTCWGYGQPVPPQTFAQTLAMELNETVADRSDADDLEEAEGDEPDQPFETKKPR